MNDAELISGDMVQVTMARITPEVYDHFFSTMQNTMKVPTPADLLSNISGGTQGYFSVRTTSSRTVVP